MTGGIDAAASLSPEQRRNVRMGRVMWLVLGTSFLLWVVLAGSGAIWVRTFVEHSARPGPTVLDQVGGVVLYKEAGQRAEVSAQQGMQLFDGDELATSFGSTATLTGFDGSVMQLYPEARVRVDAARIGRFNPAATDARFTLVSGTMRLTIPPDRDQSHTLRVTTPSGAAAFTPGRYTLRAWPGATRLSVWEGQVDAVVNGVPLQVPAGRKLVAAPASSPPIQVVDLLENALWNGNFARSFESWDPWEDREQGRPDVPGRMQIVRSEGPGSPSQAVRISRTSERDAHNETGLRQTVDRDVAGAQAIRIEATVRVDEASLSGGGYLGSEYPLMLRVRARDRRGGDQIWTQGFYYANPEARPTQVGQLVGKLVPQHQWVLFSADLTDVFRQASTIDMVEVSGAGHTFDASVGDVKLLVD